ncbi:MAG: hypothetical protein AAFO07_04390 [Bacteroidota bacterium]
MKSIKQYSSIFFFLGLLLFIGCEKEEFEFPDSMPRIVGDQDLRSMPGSTVTINTSISDPAGLTAVALTYAPWGLSETRSLGSSETAYDFTYELEVPTSADVGSTHELILTATNINDIVTTYSISLVLDLDVTSPNINNNTDLSGVTFLGDGDDVVIEIEAFDNDAIATFSITGGSLSEVVNVGAAAYTYTRGLNIQAEGAYEFIVEVTDVEGNVSTETFTVAALNATGTMFLADVDNDAALQSDLMGVPMLINTFAGEDSLGKVFEALYYSAAPNTEVRFLPNENSFSPMTIGAASEDGKLTASGDVTVAPVILPEEGYYRILIDLRDLSYTVETYTPTDDPHPTIIFMGTGVNVNGQSTCINNADGSDGACWWFGSGKELTPDANNPYRFTGVVELYDYDPDVSDDNNGFILGANLAGWSPFWRFDSGANPQATVPNGGENFTFESDAYGMYNVTFDTHLNRLIMVSQ